MKKIIRKFWGVGLVLILLSMLLIGAVPQASAGPYVFFNSFATPNSFPTDTTLAPAAPLGGFSILDVDQSGSTMILTATDNTPANWIYRSVDSGATWTRVIPVAGPVGAGVGAGPWNLVAIAPDDPNVFAVVDTSGVPNTVWLTINGGITFSALTALGAGTNFTNSHFINDIVISPLFGASRFLTITGNTEGLAAPVQNATGFILQWTIGAIAPAWAAPGVVPAAAPFFNNGLALSYSTNFLADQSLLLVTANHTGGTTPAQGFSCLRVFSYNTGVWDAAVDPSFPRMLEQSTQTYPAITATANSSHVVVRAEIALDANFYLGDLASQIGFIGAMITDNVGTQIGGVYRIGTYTVAAGVYTLTQLMTGTGINSVAWDGTNLMAAEYENLATPAAALTVWRSANALATIGTTFLPSSAFKTLGTGSFPLVRFNGGSGYGFSRGTGAAVARTMDYGMSFNGIALVNSHFGNMLDFWVSPDASRMYALTSDNSDLNLWRRDGWTWQRVFLLPGVATQVIATDPAWLVRAADGDSSAVYLGRKGTQNMYRSTDAGETVWQVRATPANIADFAVQSADIVYLAEQGFGLVAKSVTGAFTWLPPVTVAGTGGAGGTAFHINLIADDQIVVGLNAGGVAISADGGATFTYLGAQFGFGNTLVDASGVAAGDTVFALDVAGAGSVYYWTIGASVAFAAGQLCAGATGIAYCDGVLYINDDAAGAAAAQVLYRYLYPTNTTLWALGPTDAIAITGNHTLANMVNALQNSVQFGSAQLWVRNANANFGTLDTIDTFEDYLTGPEDAPIPTYPINNAIIPINSISGIVNAFVFQWDASPTITFTGPPWNSTYNYNVIVYLDEAGTIPVAGSLVLAQIISTNAPTAAVASTALLPAPGFAGLPGTTYYWRTRVDAWAVGTSAVESYWSDMQTFVVQQLTAIVPVISAPTNGSSVDSQHPAFSWSPIANATSYRFELATDADFTDIIYTVDPASAGAAVPASTSLTRGATYFWRVKALTPTEGEWSTVANFMVAELPTEQAPPVVITEAPTPEITVQIPQATTTVITIPPTPVEEVNPSYIWAIIIIGAVLVIAVIVLIVRTRRSV